MSFATFSPSIDPSPSTGRKTLYKVLAADFGDGYSQPSGDGINYRKRQLTLAWDVLTDDQADAIAGFFDARTKTTPFYYTPPRESTPVKWICDEWSDEVQAGGFRKITATLFQSYLLDS